MGCRLYHVTIYICCYEKDRHAAIMDMLDGEWMLSERIDIADNEIFATGVIDFRGEAKYAAQEIANDVFTVNGGPNDCYVCVELGHEDLHYYFDANSNVPFKPSEFIWWEGMPKYKFQYPHEKKKIVDSPEETEPEGGLIFEL